jgi:hypothetical protein
VSRDSEFSRIRLRGPPSKGHHSILSNKESIVSSSSERKESESKAATPAEQPQQQQRIEVDDTRAVSSYANFCRVTGTPEEMIIDFGLNPQPFGMPSHPVTITQRIVTNYFTAKRMLQALHITVQRHEQAFGVLETDVQKRVVGGGRG